MLPVRTGVATGHTVKKQRAANAGAQQLASSFVDLLRAPLGNDVANV